MSDDKHDDYVATIWPRVELGEGTVAKLAPSGMVKLEQTTGGELVTIWLAPDQVAQLLAVCAARLTPSN
jgi:hypothetical protein